MKHGNGFADPTPTLATELRVPTEPLHSAWRAFIRYCAELQHGEIEVLKIQDGLPILAEVTRKKVKFAP
ncbi:MAG: hypothetical protein ACRD9S_03170 [Pyrinomonadaceae bacterium]